MSIKRYKDNEVLAAGMQLTSLHSYLSPLPAHFVQVNSHVVGNKGQLLVSSDARL